MSLPPFTSFTSLSLFFTGVQSCVNVNGYLSPFFVLSRGVRQGCPPSPLLYMLVSEVLAVNIRANPRITGLSIPGSQTPLSRILQYADDTSLIVNSDDAILAVFDTYSGFEAASGSKMNLSKSKGLSLGAWNNRRDPLVQLEWTSEKIKVLGVYVGPGDLEEANWRPRIAAVENVILAFCPPFTVPCCLPCGKSKGRILKLLLFCRWLTFSISLLSCH